MRLRGRAALITGASRGIGLACARALAAEGASLCCVSRGREALGRAVEELSASGARAVSVVGDVSEPFFAEEAFRVAEAELGPVSVLVNNAAVLEIGPLAELPVEAWDRVMGANLRGAFLFAQAAVRRMVPRGEGRVIAVSSISGSLGTPRLAAYCASKWGLNGLVKSLAAELRGTGVLSLGVAPGSVDTEMLARSGFPPDMTPEDVATVVRFLATEAPAAMQGSIVEMFG